MGHFAGVSSVAILSRSVPRSVFAACFSLPSSIFYHSFGLRSLAFGLRRPSKDPRPKTQDRLCACVAEQLKPLTVNQASLKRLRRCESCRMHQPQVLRCLIFVLCRRPSFSRIPNQSTKYKALYSKKRHQTAGMPEEHTIGFLEDSAPAVRN